MVTVKWWFDSKQGYGFIKLDNGGEDISGCHTCIVSSGFSSFGGGDKVSCRTETSSNPDRSPEIKGAPREHHQVEKFADLLAYDSNGSLHFRDQLPGFCATQIATVRKEIVAETSLDTHKSRSGNIYTRQETCSMLTHNTRPRGFTEAVAPPGVSSREPQVRVTCYRGRSRLRR